LSVVVGSLHRTYDERVGPTAVETEIQRVADRFTGARIRAFVPLFVRRYAGARLRAIQPEPRPSPDSAATVPGQADPVPIRDHRTS
jgi:hypothetical protein